MVGKIIIADNGLNTRNMVRRHYDKLVLDAPTFLDARELLGKKNIALLIAEILDVTQSHYRIGDLVRDARKPRKDGHLPVIIYTSESISEKFFSLAQSLEPDVMLSKTWGVERLYGHVDRLLMEPTTYQVRRQIEYCDVRKV